jgi:hypothetical protein
MSRAQAAFARLVYWPRGSVAAPNREIPHSVARVLHEDKHSRTELRRSLGQNRREPAIHRLCSFVGKPEKNDARAIQHSEREYLAEIQIECENDTVLGACAIHDVLIRRALHVQVPDVNCIVPELAQEVDCLRRNPRVGEEPRYLAVGIG